MPRDKKEKEWFDPGKGFDDTQHFADLDVLANAIKQVDLKNLKNTIFQNIANILRKHDH